MLVERTDVTVRAGQEAAFHAAMTERGVPLLESVAGVLWSKIGRGVERPQAFMLLVAWESMEAHHAYWQTAECAELRELMTPHAEGATMEHYEMPG